MTTPTTTLRRAFLALLATATLAGCGADPGVSPTTDAAPSASTAPSETPTRANSAPAATGLTAPGEVTVWPTLPDALPLPDDIWDQTGPGWVLATYRPTYWSKKEGYERAHAFEPELVRHVVYLVSPEGERYQVLELDVERDIIVESWTAGETRAIVREKERGKVAYEDPFDVEWLDLTTGEVSPYPTPDANADVVMTLSDSLRVWHGSREDQLYINRGDEFIPLAEGWGLPQRDPLTPSPDGNWLAVLGWGRAGYPSFDHQGIGVADLSTGQITQFPDFVNRGFCEPRGWTEEANLLVGCRPDQTYPPAPFVYYEAVPSTGLIDGSTYVDPAEDPIGLHHDFWIAPGVWVGNGGLGAGEGEERSFGVGIEDHGVVSEILIVDEEGNQKKAPDLWAVVNGVLYLSNPFRILVSYDLATGRHVTLLPPPPNASDFGTDAYTGAEIWWVVAP